MQWLRRHLRPRTIVVTAPGAQIFSNNNVSGGVGVYWMLYTGANYEPLEVGSTALAHLAATEEGTVEGLRLRAGLAMSQDGRHWARIEGDHHTGALLVEGGPGEWDQAGIVGPSVRGRCMHGRVWRV